MRWRPHKWADQQTAAPRKLQALLHALASFADADGIAYPSQAKIMPRIGLSKGTIKKWSNLGRALGLFSTKKRFNRRKGHCDAMVYTLHLDRVVTAEEVATKIAELRSTNPKGKSQKKRFASEAKTATSCHTQIATGGKQLHLKRRKSGKKKEVLSEVLPAEVGQTVRCHQVMPASAEPSPTRDWLLVTEPDGEA
jgi:hypothetical protein